MRVDDCVQKQREFFQHCNFGFFVALTGYCGMDEKVASVTEDVFLRSVFQLGSDVGDLSDNTAGRANL